MASISERQQAALASNPWFAALGPAIGEAIVMKARLQQLAVGQRLFSRGDAGDGWYGVLEGSVRISGTSQEGREALLTFIEPGSWFGEISQFDGQARTHDARAYLPTLLLKVAPADFELLLSAHPALSRAFLRLECTRVRHLMAALEGFSTQSVEQRLAGRLLGLSQAFGASTPVGLRIELHLSQEALSQLVGVSRQRINQLLKEWEDAGLVVQRYGRILLTDCAALERLAGA